MKKYKIVVLLKLDTAAQLTLKSAVSLAKMINGEIEVFCVKKPNEIIDRESQLSAMRTISSKRLHTKKKMQKLISPISQENGINIKHSFAFGNVKNEIQDFVEEKQPDIVVLGKPKTKVFNLIGDNVIGYVLDFFKGAVMIANRQKAMEPNEELSMGILNSTMPSLGLEFADKLIEHTQKPLKSFKIQKGSVSREKISEVSGTKTVEYVFEQGDNAMKGISNFVAKSSINLLYIERNGESPNRKSNLISSSIRRMVKDTNVNLLLAGS